MRKSEIREVDIEQFGNYRLGLTEKEIKEYLKMRAKTTKLGNLYKQFCKVAGVNTMVVIVTECCRKSITLMYRWDVKRFTDLLLESTPTYWD